MFRDMLRQLGAIPAGRRGDPCSDAPTCRVARGDPRPARRHGREPAIRARCTQPGGLGTSLGVPGRRVRMGARGTPGGQLEEWGKTEHSTERRTAIPSLLRADLSEWRAALIQAGDPVHECDFIIPGNLTGAEHGIREPSTGACHLSNGQARSWGARFFTPGRQESRAAPRARPDHWRDALRASPWRHLPTAPRRGSSNRRQRARNQPEDAQRALRIRHRRSPPRRT
jgi:hypothetical protein